jgi:outer membrane protein
VTLIVLAQHSLSSQLLIEINVRLKIMKYLIIILFICFFTVAKAQDTIRFNLDQCVAHAMNENINLKIKRNLEKKALYDRQQSQWEIAPSLSGSGNSNFNFRRATNQNNEISSGTSYRIGYGLSSSMTLFSGFTQINTIKANQYNELVYKESTQFLANSLYIQIIEMFTKVLFNKSMLNVAEERLEISKKQKERIEALIEAGQMEPVALFEINATVSGNQLYVNRINNSYTLFLLQLAQLIEIPDDVYFEIDSNEFEQLIPKPKNYSLTSVYSKACTELPQIKQKEYELEYVRKIVSINKGHLAPSLNLNAGYGSGYYSTDTLNNGLRSSFGNQFNDYLNPSLSISLSIPIFGNLYRKYNVKKSKIDMENSMYDLQNERKQIRREIQEGIQRLEAYHLEYVNSSDNLKFVLKSFETYQEKYRLGLINSTDFITAQNQLSEARINIESAKYNWIVQEKMIKLYMGEEY